MASIPQVSKGFFLVRKSRKVGGWLYTTFPLRDKAYYLGRGWQEISPELAAEQQKPVAPPLVEIPESIAKQVVPTKAKPKGRPKRVQA
jgi:hypothetical protein